MGRCHDGFLGCFTYDTQFIDSLWWPPLPPAPMADDDFCVVCAEPLEWVAYGNCGHRDACSKCVSRLRFVMKDTRCLICQQQDSPVVVTRSLGAYTPVIPPQDFDKLQVSSLTTSRASKHALAPPHRIRKQPCICNMLSALGDPC